MNIFEYETSSAIINDYLLFIRSDNLFVLVRYLDSFILYFALYFPALAICLHRLLPCLFLFLFSAMFVFVSHELLFLAVIVNRLATGLFSFLFFFFVGNPYYIISRSIHLCGVSWRNTCVYRLWFLKTAWENCEKSSKQLYISSVLYFSFFIRSHSLFRLSSLILTCNCPGRIYNDAINLVSNGYCHFWKISKLSKLPMHIVSFWRTG